MRGALNDAPWSTNDGNAASNDGSAPALADRLGSPSMGSFPTADGPARARSPAPAVVSTPAPPAPPALSVTPRQPEPQLPRGGASQPTLLAPPPPSDPSPAPTQQQPTGVLLDEAIAELEAIVPETTNDFSGSGPSHQGAHSVTTADSEESGDSGDSEDSTEDGSFLKTIEEELQEGAEGRVLRSGKRPIVSSSSSPSPHNSQKKKKNKKKGKGGKKARR